MAPQEGRGSSWSVSLGPVTEFIIVFIAWVGRDRRGLCRFLHRLRPKN